MKTRAISDFWAIRVLAPNTRRPHRSSRGGFSLLEAVLALAIFFASAAALGQLLMVGWKMARWAEAVSEATLRCESKMAEIVTGLASTDSQPPTPFDDDEDWESEVDVAPTGVPALVRITVTVRHFTRDNRDIEVHLARLLADPHRLEVPEMEATFPSGPPTPPTVEEMLGLPGVAR